MNMNVKVDLGERSYDIVIGEECLDSLGAYCERVGLSGRCLIVSDSNVDPLYGAQAEAALAASGYAVSRVVVPTGEASKSIDQLKTLYSVALAGGLDRKSFIVALGGGVVGDLAGYLAASLFRGVDFVQVPTSLLAMVDSAVGGKTGVNLPEGKNLVGAFHQPRLVVADIAVLATLPKRELSAGLAEVVKYGVIWDAELFALLEAQAEEILKGDRKIISEIIARSCEIKAEVVRQDEREGGLRAILNYGHTLGHAIEQVAGYGKHLHGEAISMGMVYAAGVSSTLKGFPEDEAKSLQQLLTRFELPTAHPDLEWAALRAAMGVDKKVAGGMPLFVLTRAIGVVEFGCEVKEDLLQEQFRAWA